ncbi:hypothetical protein [Blautia sp. MSJ-9]|nr:hypothetical protein [Blautia sp. MSJ-9]
MHKRNKPIENERAGIPVVFLTGWMIESGCREAYTKCRSMKA